MSWIESYEDEVIENVNHYYEDENEEVKEQIAEAIIYSYAINKDDNLHDDNRTKQNDKRKLEQKIRTAKKHNKKGGYQMNVKVLEDQLKDFDINTKTKSSLIKKIYLLCKNTTSNKAKKYLHYILNQLDETLLINKHSN